MTMASPTHPPLRGATRRQAEAAALRDKAGVAPTDGAMWLVGVGIFTAICVIPLVLVLFDAGQAAPVAAWALPLVLLTYAGLIAVRFTVKRPRSRLRWMALLMLGEAVIALAAMVACVVISLATAFV